jgi:hypothetical protein
MKYFGHRSIFKKNNNWGYSYRSNLNARFLSPDPKLGSYLIQSNSEGFRTHLNSQDFVKSSRKKILLIGCSFAAGDGVSNNQRFFDIFCNESGYTFYNAAIPGTGHDQQLLILRYLVKKLRPDYVLFAPYSGCANRNLTSSRTFHDPLHGGYTNRPKPFFKISDGLLYLKNMPIPAWEILSKDKKNHKFTNILSQLTYFRLKEFNKIYTGHDKYGNLLTKTIIKEIFSLTVQNGAKLIIMPLPAEHDVTSTSNHVNSFYSKLSEELNFFYIDLQSKIDKLDNEKIENFFISFDGHYSPNGHQIIAEIFKNSVVWD